MNRFMKKVHEGWTPPRFPSYVPYETKVTMGPLRRVLKVERPVAAGRPYVRYRLSCGHTVGEGRRTKRNVRFAHCDDCAMMLWKREKVAGHRRQAWARRLGVTLPDPYLTASTNWLQRHLESARSVR